MGHAAARAGSYVDPALADRHSDLLFSAQIGSEPVLVYLLLEHQSSVDPLMPLRILIYMVRVWERRIADAKGTMLPPIIPVVVSHAREGWDTPTRMHELISPTLIAIPEVAELIPDFRFLVDDLAAATSEELHARALDVFPKVALWLLRNGRNARALIRGLDAWAEAFHEVALAPNGIAAMARLLRYLDLVLSEKQFERFRGKLVRLAPGTKEAEVHYGERREQQGLAKGLEQGLERGRRQMLLDMLALKFGPLEQHVIDRVDKAADDELLRWAERMLAVTQLDAVFER